MDNEILKIQGGRPLSGEVSVRGAKNSVPKLMVAALLTSDRCRIDNVADIQDVEIVSDMIQTLGGTVETFGSGRLELTTADLHPAEVGVLQRFSEKSRIPILLAGPLLARLGSAIIPALGGCRIGHRPVDFHVAVLQSLGATVQETPDGFYLRAPKGLSGTKIALPYPSVGATEQVLLSSVLAEGVTEISNAAVEPEIVDLIAVLQKMGAIISIDTDRVVHINGVSSLSGFTHFAMPDRLEVASWACAAAITNGRIFVRGARQLDMMTFLNMYRKIGGAFEVDPDGIAFWRSQHAAPLQSTVVETDVHPGFMTDWLQPFVLTLTQAKGVSIAHETVYENRFGYISALQRMGANIQLYRECLGSTHCRFGQRNHIHSAVVVGPTRLTAAEIQVPDLRGGFSYVIAALAAEGESTISNIRIIRRGYEDFFGKLRSLGATIEIG